jgi:hypothetical protein
MRNTAIIFSLIFVFCLGVTVGAEVVLKQQMSFEMMGMPATDMLTTVQISADKSYTRTEFKPGSMMAMMGGQQPAEVNITRLDKAVMWNLNESAKTYMEFNLADIKQMMNANDSAAADVDAVDKYEWTFDVKKQDETTLNGLPCKGIIATATGVNKEDPTDKVVLGYEQWSSDKIPGKETLDAFSKRFSEITGLDPYGRDQITKNAAAMYGKQLMELAKKADELQGYPIKIIITGKTTGKVDLPMGMSEEDMKEMDPRAAAMMKQMMEKKGEASPDGMNSLFSVKIEVLDVGSKAADNSIFEIPEGYTQH